MELSLKQMYKAVAEKDISYEGIFFFAIRTTGIFCRPSCPARTAKFENIEFFKSTKECIISGYRACKVCKPLEKLGETPDYIKNILNEIAEDPGVKLKDWDLRQKGIEPNQIRRWFLKNHGINMVTSTYPDSWKIVYESDDLDGMARAYSSNYVNRNLDFGTDNIVNLVNDFSLDGIIYHSNRSCKLMDFRQYEVERKVQARTGVPSVIFDGDQTDPRAFSLAQYETRVQALVEMMERNKRKDA